MKGKFISIYLSIVLLVLVCVSGTMAYFTDSTEAKMNTIVSGNLDVEVEYSEDDGKTWHPLTPDSDILAYLPGVTNTVLVRISNEGSLALKYEFSTLAAEVILGQNDEGKDINLADYLEISVAGVKHFKTDEEFRQGIESADKGATVENLSNHKIGNTLVKGELAPGASQVLRLAVLLPSTVGNEANYRVSTDPSQPDMFRPYIHIGLFVAATQASAESDSFDNTYDQNATVPTH